jgi:hypothetical protein
MADDDDNQGDGAGDGGGELSDEGRRMLDHFGKRARQEFNEVLDERLRVEQGTAGDGGGDGEKDGKDGKANGDSGDSGSAPGGSLAERLGFGGN